MAWFDRMVEKQRYLESFGLLLASAVVLLAQETATPPEIKSSVNLVQVTAVARDNQGRSLENLRERDFSLTDNGRLQKLARFRYIANASSPSSKPNEGSPTTRATSAATEDVRSLFVVIPRLGFESRHYALDAMQQAVHKRLLEGYSVAIVDNSGLFLPFTKDINEISRAINEMRTKNLNPCYQSPWWAKAKEVLLSMAHVPGRKFMVMFSDLQRPIECRDQLFLVSNSPFRFLVDAQASNVAVYPVDPRGPVPVLPFGDATTSSYHFTAEGAFLSGSAVLGQTTGQLSALAQEKMALDYVAMQTGGRSLVNDNELARVFRLLNEDSNYYELDYYLPDLQADGRYHRIDIRVSRPDVKIIAKPGYFAPIPFQELSRGRKREWLYEALLAGRPLTDMRISGRADFFPNLVGNTVTVPITYEMNWWVRKDDIHTEGQWVMIVGVLEDERGFVVKRFTSTNYWKTPDGETADGEYVLRRAHYNLLAELPPATYRMRIAAADLDTNTLGSLEYSFEVAKPSGSLLTSSVILADELVPRVSGTSGAVERLNGERREGEPIPNPLVWKDARVLPAVAPIFSTDSRCICTCAFFQSRQTILQHNGSPKRYLETHLGKLLPDLFQSLFQMSDHPLREFPSCVDSIW